MPTPAIADVYRDAHAALDALVRPLSPADLERPAPCCPGWTVHDVVCHLAITAEHALAGRLGGIPTDDVTAAQVAEGAGVPTVELLDRWAVCADALAAFGAEHSVWPVAIDALSHEFDVRHALGDRGGRERDAVRTVATAVLRGWRPPVPVRVVTPDGEHVAGEGADDLTDLALHTTAFELVRARLGRRSRDQLLALDWRGGDPAPLVESFVVFGPAAAAIDE